jgi:hypothetical protein
MLIQHIATSVHIGRDCEPDAVGARGRKGWRFVSASNCRRPPATSLTAVFGVSTAGLLAPLYRGPA